MKEPQIAAESVGQHERVSAIIFRSGDRVTVAEAVELLRIEPEDGDAPLEQDFDDGVRGHLDSDDDLRDIAIHTRQKFRYEALERLAVVLHLQLL
jgi:hypothetical protein